MGSSEQEGEESEEQGKKSLLGGFDLKSLMAKKKKQPSQDREPAE